jgi:HEAT repeat protein
MEPVPLNIKQIIEDLSNGEIPLINTGLADLSNLSSTSLAYFSQTWTEIEEDRRRKIINRLVELAEENFELNFDSIFKSVLKDRDAEVRAKAIEGLWESEETALIIPFVRILDEDSSEIVQAAAAKALSKYAMLAELKKLGPSSTDRVTMALLSILADDKKPREVWRRALEAAAPLSHPEVKRAIHKAYQSDDIKLKNSAIFAMGKNCDSSWLPTVIKELSNTRAETRYEAAGACGEICDEEAVPQLIKLTSDSDQEVQGSAIRSLGQIGGAKAKLHLRKLLESPDEIVSEAAETALRQLEMEEDSFIL